MTPLYTKDDVASWSDWTAKHPLPESKTQLPWAAKSAQEREDMLRYMARYYNEIIMRGGIVDSGIAAQNPYVLVWDGARQKYVTREEGVKSREHMGIDAGAADLTSGPSTMVMQEPAAFNPKVVPVTGVTVSAPAPRSFWQRIKAFFRRLFN